MTSSHLPGLRLTAAIASCAALLGLAACSGDSGSSATSSKEDATTSERAPGPAADLSARLTGGEGVVVGQAAPDDLASAGYVQREYAAEGTATSYTSAGALTADGRWDLAPDASAPYRTRVLVRAPRDPAKFSGTVMVEWLNVSGGADANPEWASVREEVERSGDVWVGVSAQRIGVEGGPVLVEVDIPGAEDQGKGLKALDPVRYGDLEHPGDGFSFDIFTQVARALRTGAGLEGLRPKRVVAGGESQSAFALVSYYNGVQPLTRAFDGFFVHSRGAVGLPLVGPGEYADIAGAISGTPTIFRTDQTAPVLDVQTESDVTSILNSYAARQPDSDRFRLWEVAGTAHADAHLVGPSADLLECGVPINDGPMHIVAKAAWRALKDWLLTGAAPAAAPRLEVTAEATPQIRRDGDGIALGGIRTPPVDVPVTALSGAPGPNPSTICLLLGSATPLPEARLAELYDSRAEYRQRYRAATAATIEAGFALPADRAALLGFGEPSSIAG